MNWFCHELDVLVSRAKELRSKNFSQRVHLFRISFSEVDQKLDDEQEQGNIRFVHLPNQVRKLLSLILFLKPSDLKEILDKLGLAHRFFHPV